MTKENLIPKTEIVREIESETLSYEEFMKTYEGSNLNYDDLDSGSIGESKEYGPMPRHQQQLQTQKQMSVQEKKAIYDLFCASIERLEKYIEINYKKEFPDWENREQIHLNSVKIENPYQYIERFESGIRNQLRLTDEILENYTTSEFRRELRQEFNKWIKTVAIDINNCPEKLRNFLFEINEVLEGGGKLERESYSQKTSQPRTNSQIIRDIKSNPRNWRLDEIPTEIGSFGRTKQEFVLIHRSAREDDFDSEGKLNFANNPIYRINQFNQVEIEKVNKALNISGDYYLGGEENYEILSSRREQRQTSWQTTENFYQEKPVASTYTKYQGAVESGRSIRINKKTRIKGFQHLIHAGNDWADKNGGSSTKRGELWDEEVSSYSDGSFRFSSITTSAGANVGIGGAIASGGAGYSMFGVKDNGGEAKFLSLSAGGEIGAGPGGIVAGYSLSADVASVQAGGFSVNVGYDAGSGVSFGAGGIEAKVAGVGVSIGKKMGISTPVGGISIDLGEACVVQ